MTGILLSCLFPWGIAIGANLPSPSSDIFMVVVGIWAAGSVVTLLVEAVLVGLMAGILRQTRPPAAIEWAVISRQLSWGQSTLRITERNMPPSIGGMIRPMCLLPIRFFAEGAENDLHWALKYLNFARSRQKAIWQILLLLNRVVFWWNPLNRRLASAWLEAREMVSDSKIATSPQEREAYRRFLLSASDHPTNPSKRLQRRLNALEAP